MIIREIKSLTVVMPTFNGEQFLCQQLDSILAQTYHDFTLHIFDDCSRDKTIDIVEKYIQKDERIILHRNSKQLGPVKNFEQAIDRCDTEYIALSDQDDVWENNKLELLVANIKSLEQKHQNIPLLVHSDLSMIDDDDNTIHPSYFVFRNYQHSASRDVAYMVGPCGVMGNTILMNRKLKEIAMPFPDGLAVHDYWLALVNEIFGERKTVDSTLVHYRIHEKNTSNSTDILKHDYREIFSKTIQLKIPLPYMGIGREKVLHDLLDRYELSDKDTMLVTIFLAYLNFTSNRLGIFFRLAKHGLIRKGFIHRLRLFLMILLTREYS